MTDAQPQQMDATPANREDMGGGGAAAGTITGPSIRNTQHMNFKHSRTFIHYVDQRRVSEVTQEDPEWTGTYNIMTGWSLIPWYDTRMYMTQQDAEMIANINGSFKINGMTCTLSKFITLEDGVSSAAGAVDLTTTPSNQLYFYLYQDHDQILPPCCSENSVNYWGSCYFPKTRTKGLLSEYWFNTSQTLQYQINSAYRQKPQSFDFNLLNTGQWTTHNAMSSPVTFSKTDGFRECWMQPTNGRAGMHANENSPTTI